MKAQDKQQTTEGTEPTRRASEVQPKRVRWLYEHRIPRGEIAVVAGKPDQGKGLFAAHVAAAVSRTGKKVLYSALEDDPETMTRPRLEAAGADLDNVFLWGFQLPAQMNELTAHVRAEGIKLVVMDPFSAHLHGVSKYADSIRKVLTPLTKLAQSADCTILVVEHALKKISPTERPLAAVSGSSSGLAAAARAVFVFGVNPKDEDQRVLCTVKLNQAEKPLALAYETDIEEVEKVGKMATLLRGKELEEFSPMKLLTASGKDGKRKGMRPEKRAAASEWIIRYLFAAGSPVKAGEVKEDGARAGFTSKVLRSAAEDVRVIKDPPGGGRACTWELPSDLTQLLTEEAMEDGV